MRKIILLVITTLVLANFLNTFVQAQCVQPPSDMVAWFPFDENTGNVAGNKMSIANQGTMNGATWGSGKVSNALSFPGSNSAVQANDYPAINFGTGDFSIDAWIRLPNTAAGQGIKTIVDKRNGTLIQNTTGYLFFINNGKLALQLMPLGSNFQYYSTTTLPVGSWVHVAVTVDRDDSLGIKFYLNGTLAGTANPTNRQGNLSNPSPLRIGKQANSSFFNGGIDEVQLFNRVLTITEIAAIFNAGADGNCKPSSPPTPPQPMVQVSNNIVQNVPSSSIIPTGTDVYFAFEHPLSKWIIVAGWDQVNFKNVVKSIAPNGTISNIALPKCRGLYNNPPAGVDLQMTVRSVTFGGDLIVTGQFDRCELMAGDPYPPGMPGIVKVKANGQIDHNFNPDFYPANYSMCQTVGMPPYTRKYCPPVNFQAIQAFNGDNSIFLYGNFQTINGTLFSNPTNLIKLNV